MKSLLFTVALLATGQALASTNDHRAISVEVRGKNGGFDSLAYEETRKQLGEFVADGTLDRFVVYRYYANGGFAACGELGSTALTSRLKDITTRLLNIRYDASITSFWVGTEQRCR